MDLTMKRELARQIAGISEPVQDADELFLRTLARLKSFRAAYAHTPEPLADDAGEARLGRWLEAQRGDLRRGALCEERRNLLDEAIGQDWMLEASRRSPASAPRTL